MKYLNWLIRYCVTFVVLSGLFQVPQYAESSMFKDGLIQHAGVHFDNTDTTEYEQEKAVKLLIERLLPKKEDQFEIEVDFNFEDAFKISTRRGKIFIKGNKGYSAAAGFYHYLKRYCGAHVSWSGDQLDVPHYLPRPNKTKTIFNDKYRYYQNVCASSYSYVWWTWDRWEKEIDWMALNGINLALAFSAQEAIQHKVFKSFNFTDHQINVLFTGPAFLAWSRMGNVQAWAGPLTENWHSKQILLQHRILNRMRSFGIIPVLPAFSGRVIPAFKSIFPNAETTYLKKEWGHFTPPFGEVTFLQPTDPLFKRIGALFLRSYIDEFGTNHFYNTDLFNEMPPPSNSTEYLANCSRAVYETLTLVDPAATWITQGWMFFSDPDFWQPDQAKAFLTAIPLGKMIVLDLQSEMYPQYHRLNSYYGQPFIWCMLHNYGGVTGLYGSLDQVNNGPFEGRNFNGSTMIGTGITPEGIETNDIVYELMNEMAWRKKPVDLNTWIEDYAQRRYGVNSRKAFLGLLQLKSSVYNATAPNRNHGRYVLTRRPSFKLKDDVWYDPDDVFLAWWLFLNATDNIKLANSYLFRHDLVDISRQGLQLLMGDMYDMMKLFYEAKDEFYVWYIGHEIGTLFDNMEELLASDDHFLLGRWIQAARSFGVTEREKAGLEYNAKNQITLWGPSGELLDYASKQWSGLMKDYYKERWQLFLRTVVDCLHENSTFNQAEFNKDVFKKVESAFAVNWISYPTEPKGDPVEISKRIFNKYRIM